MLHVCSFIKMFLFTARPMLLSKPKGKRTWSGESSKRSKVARPGSAYYTGDPDSETNLLTPASEGPVLLATTPLDESTGNQNFKRAVVKAVIAEKSR